MNPMHSRILRGVLVLVLNLGGSLFAEPPVENAPAAPTKPSIAAETSAKDKELADMAAWLEKAYAGRRPPESVRMLIAISRGSMMRPGDGWFGPGETRYTWDWLARLHGADSSKGITSQQFRGSKELFARLDRNRDGILNADDFDWSEKSLFVRQMGQAQYWLGSADTDGDRKLSKAEWDALFQKMAQSKDYLNAEDVRAMLFPPVPVRPAGPPPDMPTKAILLKGLFSGELGSPSEGPRLGEPAPDFVLKSPDGLKTVTLSKLIGPKPLVLIFGSFT
jgi:hypothetical protein